MHEQRAGEAKPTALVVGAGAVGTASALALARKGFSTRLVDWRAPGEGCSFGNAGALSPESVVPIALPGMLAQVPGWLVDPEGPLHVRWRYLPRALPWLARWVAASRGPVVRRSSHALKALVGETFEAYRALLGEQLFAGLVRRHGQLYVWESSEPSRSERAGHALRQAQGVEMHWLDPAGIAALEPALAPIFARGLYLPRNGQLVEPLRLVRAMVELFRAEGGVVERGRVRAVEPAEGGGAHGASLALEDGRRLSADRVVVAAGAWSHRLVRPLGPRVPLETERGYHAMFAGGQALASRPVMHADRAFIATPMAEGLRVAGTVEIAGTEAPADMARARALAGHARRMFPDLGPDEPTTWMGCRPSLPDSLPVIDRVPGLPSVLMAFGHGHLGMTGAATTARLVAELAADEPASIELAPYRVTRF